jgi:hypothetical protein
MRSDPDEGPSLPDRSAPVFRASREDGVTVVRLAGEHDRADAAELRRALRSGAVELGPPDDQQRAVGQIPGPGGEHRTDGLLDMGLRLYASLRELQTNLDTVQRKLGMTVTEKERRPGSAQDNQIATAPDDSSRRCQ